MRRVLVILLSVTAVAAACDRATVGGSAGDGGDAQSRDGGDVGGSRPDADSDATGPMDAGSSATLPDGRCISGAFLRDGVCTCQDGFPEICAELCVDLTSDDGNCGACGHVCPASSTCAEGVCHAAPVVVVPANPGCQSIDLATSGGTLYWTDRGHGLVVSLAPGAAAPTTIASGEGAPTRIVARAGASPGETTLFWVDETDKTVRRMAASGGPPVTLATATATTEMGGLTLSPDGASVYFSARPTIFRVPAAGGQAVPAVTDGYNDGAAMIAIVGNQMVFPTSLGGHVLLATLAENDVALCNKFDAQGIPDTTTCRRIGSSHGAAELIISLDGRVFWSNSTNVVAWPTPGQTWGQEIAMSPTFEAIVAMAGASNMIYFADTAGVISKTATGPMSTAVRIARGQNRVLAMAAADARVYWSTADCTIASVER